MTANPGDIEPAKLDTSATTQRRGRIPADTLANRLVLARRLAGLTIREAAAQTGLNYGSWSNWENGMRPTDVLDVCRRVATKLDVDFDWLLFGGPLTASQGRPTGRTADDTHRYPLAPAVLGERVIRTIPDQPNGRTHLSGSTSSSAGGRRPVRVAQSVPA